MKKLWLLLALCLFFQTTLASAKPPPPGPWDPPKSPAIAGQWVGTGKLLFFPLNQETLPLDLVVTINITAQSDSLFCGSMLLTSQDGNPFPAGGLQITSLSFNIGGNISPTGDLVITGAAVINNVYDSNFTGPVRGLFKEEATALLVPGKNRRLRGNFRFTVHLNPEKNIFDALPESLQGLAFPGTFVVQQQLLR